jgi:hypothetical protein
MDQTAQDTQTLAEGAERGVSMQSSPRAVSTSVPTHDGAPTEARSHADLIYQVVTIAAVLLLLGSLWVF